MLLSCVCHTMSVPSSGTTTGNMTTSTACDACPDQPTMSVMFHPCLHAPLRHSRASPACPPAERCSKLKLTTEQLNLHQHAVHPHMGVPVPRTFHDSTPASTRASNSGPCHVFEVRAAQWVDQPKARVQDARHAAAAPASSLQPCSTRLQPPSMSQRLPHTTIPHRAG